MHHHARSPRWRIGVLAFTVGLAAIAFPSNSVAYVLDAHAVDPAPVENQDLALFVAGESSDPCFAIQVEEGEGGLIEAGRIRLVFSLLDTSGGNPCITVIAPFDFTYTFVGGFAAGAYTVEIVERTFLGPIVFVERTVEFDLVISPDEPGVEVDRSNWGAVKALYEARSAR